MICPKCGFETDKESCPSCGVIFAKIHPQGERPAPARQPSRSVKPFAWDIAVLKILWLSVYFYFAVQCFGISGEGGLFCAIFYMAMAFPSSLLMYCIFPFMPWFTKYFGPKSEDVIFFFTILILGYFQWFVLIPRISAAARSYIHEKSLSSPRTGKYLTNGLHWTRLTLRWGGCGYFLVMALVEMNVMSIFYALGAFVVVLVFRPREIIKRNIDKRNTKEGHSC